MVPMRTMVAILSVTRDVFAGGHRARGNITVEGRADRGIGDAFFGLRHLRAHAFERSLRGFHRSVTLPRGVQRALHIAAGRRWPARRPFPAGCGLFRRRCGKRRRSSPDFRSAWRRPRRAWPAPAPIRNWPSRRPLREPCWRRRFDSRCKSDARLRLADGGGGFLELRAHLVEPQLRVAMIQLADDLALLHEIANIDRRRDHAAGDGGRDVGGFVGDKGSGFFEIRRIPGA